MQEIEWRCKPFDDLTAAELYAVHRLRNEVFVVEQNCVYQDADNKDQLCYHLMGWADNHLVAYSRIVPKGVAFPFNSIGRVVSSPLYRKKGSGKALMIKSIKICDELFGRDVIKIGAQLYLKKFYEGFGFKQTGEVYDEDGINHIHMLREK